MPMGAEMNRLLLAAMGALIVILAALSWTVNHYRDNAQLYKAQRDQATSSLTLANNTLTDMQARQHDVSALDAQYTGELANAKAELEKLHADVAIGRKRLQLNATCQAARSASSPRVDDGSSARLTDTAERDYFTLRERIDTVTHQLAGLQQYVRKQCIY
ncbi:prophage endopeptidase RzpD [Phytobacter diazotrophicus]|uniref:Endopeptidase n=1 Tax=Phytobacter diazotrophicus TaxID=395631 RepID=A0ABN6LTA7_9ENTR|nr:endopeptidase [Phytobacter sp. MRY16-398]BDD51987.1 endopeptidase [Phytobacter diazotrophicus]BEG82916.1 prophage endopeptidase RzpD [Phytobacter diazotrophicus]BEG88814.1 prophage endopeptidase RzpD [Phytobacter diazotrophicus]BEG94578.1 prophage endopeptidase RzpD [Phytobacter diazotrophicus]